MENTIARPDTIDNLRFSVDAAFAMLAGMQLDVFTPLMHGPMTVEQIANAIAVGPTRLRLLLYSLVAAGLLNEKDGRFSNTQESDHFLVKRSPSYLGGMHTGLSRNWVWNLKTAESLRTGLPQAKVDFSNSPREEIERFLRTMNPRTVAAAHNLLEKYDFSATKTLADVGCGGAGLALAMAKANPQMQVTAIDLPLVTPIAEKIVEEEKVMDHVKVIAADVLAGPLPGSYDVVISRALFQVLSPEDARLALRNIGAAINSGGTIYILGQILDDSRTSPPEAVGFNLIFINVYDAGEAYTEQEHRDWLTEAGFVDIKRADFFLADGLGIITARKG
jgi:SAM-dependent methyltransferase